jgi:hypothetical protein
MPVVIRAALMIWRSRDGWTVNEPISNVGIGIARSRSARIAADSEVLCAFPVRRSPSNSKMRRDQLSCAAAPPNAREQGSPPTAAAAPWKSAVGAFGMAHRRGHFCIAASDPPAGPPRSAVHLGPVWEGSGSGSGSMSGSGRSPAKQCKLQRLRVWSWSPSRLSKGRWSHVLVASRGSN